MVEIPMCEATASRSRTATFTVAGRIAVRELIFSTNAATVPVFSRRSQVASYTSFRAVIAEIAIVIPIP
jgi:hypothetical protein